MSRIRSFKELQELRDNRKPEDFPGSDGFEKNIHVKVSMATCSLAAGARPIFDFFTEQLDRRNISGIVTQTGCMGYCYAEPTIEVTLPGRQPVVFGGINEKKADEIIEKYIKTGELVDGIIPVNYETIDSKE